MHCYYKWKSLVRDCFKRFFYFLGFLGLSLLLGMPSFDAIAKGEARGFATDWMIPGNYAHFDSFEAAVSAVNEYNAASYNACVAANRDCGSCENIQYSAINPSVTDGWFSALVNGERMGRRTTAATVTRIYLECHHVPGGPAFTLGSGASIEVNKNPVCAPDMGVMSRDLGKVMVGSNQYTSLELYCYREIPEPCNSCTQFGDSIDAVAATKLETAVDYSTADTQMQVTRQYSSAAGQWVWTHDTRLVDFTGRNITSPESENLSKYVMLMPPVYYSASPVPGVPRLRSFPLIETDRAHVNKEVSIFYQGKRFVFQEGPAGAFSSSAPSKPQLVVSTDFSGATQWQVRFPESGFQLFNNSGALTKIIRPDGKYIDFSRTGAMITATAWPSGRIMVYSRMDPATPDKSYDTITLPGGASLHYKFDKTALVTEVIFADGARKRYSYDEALYTGTADVRGWLTGVIDENNIRHATYVYDGLRPKSTELAGGVNKYTFTFQPANTVVTLPVSNALSTPTWELGPDGERRVVKWARQLGGPGSPATVRNIAYDPNGNKAYETDWNGNRICYSNDLVRNLELARIEGLSYLAVCANYTPANATLPADSRKTSTQWHPDWRLPIKVAEPGKLTTYVYNGQPDPFNGNALAACAPTTALLPDGKPIAVLCRQVEQASTDTDGHLGFSATLQAGVPNRQQTWTYNPYGQVLTHNGPRTDVPDTTSYSYYADTTADHTLGDLQSVTNAKGQVTRFTQYNKAGQVLQSTDSNGALTINSYDLRQRLTSSNTAGQITTYAYHPTGLLKRFTQPDGASIDYHYDDAHRLIALSDDQGNRIDYTLDNAGNRTSEQLNDPVGALAGQLSRAFDALSRVQQAAGQE